MNEQTNLKNHVSKIIGYIRSSKAGLLITYTFVLTLNPGFAVDYSLMFNLVKSPNKLWQSASMSGGSLILGLLLILWYWVTYSKNIEPVRHVYFWNMFGIFSFLAVMMVWIYPVNPIMVYLGATLLIVTNYIIVAVCILVGIQLISRYIEEGYESFSINAVVGINNIAANISQLLAGGVGTYLQQSKYSERSALYVFLIFVESSIIPLILFFYLISIRNREKKARTRLNSHVTESDERPKTSSRGAGSLLIGGGRGSESTYRSDGQL